MLLGRQGSNLARRPARNVQDLNLLRQHGVAPRLPQTWEKKMLTKEQNERLTSVGPGTPGGELMRRYWLPIAPFAELLDNPVKKVRILGEDLTLYKDKSGNLGLIGDRCLHRNVDMKLGIPDECGLRCPYHGWLYNETGNCVERPMEGAPQAGALPRVVVHAASLAVGRRRSRGFRCSGPEHSALGDGEEQDT